MERLAFPLMLLLCLCFCSSCGIFRAVWFNIPDTDDYRHDPQRRLSAPAEAFHFFKNKEAEDLGQQLSVTYQLVYNHLPLNDFVKMFNTEAFLIIRNDTVLYERYPDSHTNDRLVTTFSISKAIIATLVGRSIKQGHLRGLDQTVGEVLPKWRSHSIGKMTVQQLLQHTSGIQFSTKLINLGCDQIQFYYGRNLRRRMNRRKLAHPPGEHFQYSSANTQLLGLMLEAVSPKKPDGTPQTLSDYLEAQLWHPLGMEASGYWSLDRRDGQAMERAFCCLQARAIDLAKLGRLWLNDGNWQGCQLLPPQWIDFIINLEHPDTGLYHCGFTTVGIGCNRAYYASGLMGQVIYVVPEKNLLILRFGEHKKAYSTNLWRDFFAQLAEKL
jgi:CubicO group peptidase (beta-lactamase class C family)